MNWKRLSTYRYSRRGMRPAKTANLRACFYGQKLLLFKSTDIHPGVHVFLPPPPPPSCSAVYGWTGACKPFHQLSLFNNRCLEDAAVPPPAGGAVSHWVKMTRWRWWAALLIRLVHARTPAHARRCVRVLSHFARVILPSPLPAALLNRRISGSEMKLVNLSCFYDWLDMICIIIWTALSLSFTRSLSVFHRRTPDPLLSPFIT